MLANFNQISCIVITAISCQNRPIKHFDLRTFQLFQNVPKLRVVIKGCAPTKNTGKVISSSKRKHSDLEQRRKRGLSGQTDYNSHIINCIAIEKTNWYDVIQQNLVYLTQKDSLKYMAKIAASVKTNETLRGVA